MEHNHGIETLGGPILVPKMIVLVLLFVLFNFISAFLV